MNKIIATAVLATAVVLAPSAASADPGHARPHGKHHHKVRSTMKVKPTPCKVVQMTPAAAASAWVPISLGLICPVIVLPPSA